MKAVVIVCRGLQAGALACYGDPLAETPAMDALAAEGIVCDQHLADGADADSARRSWRSGRHTLPGNETPSGPDLLTRLREAGIRTQLVVDGTRTVADAFAEGWDEAEGVLPDKGETALEATVAVAVETLESLADMDDWLVWIELGTTLPPWDVPEEFQAPFFQEEPAEEDEADAEEEEEDAVLESDDAEEPLTPLMDPQPGPIDPSDDHLYLRLRNSYGAAVSYLDAGVGKVWDALVALGLANDVVFLLTADVGLPLGEHGVVGAGLPLPYEEIVHVPLIVRLPGAACAGRRVNALTQGLDLLPTLASFFGVPLPASHGHDLQPLLRGDIDEVRSYAVCMRHIGSEANCKLITPEWAFLRSGPEPDLTDRPAQLFRKPDDRYEVNDVSHQFPELTEALERTLQAFQGEVARPGPFVQPPMTTGQLAE